MIRNIIGAIFTGFGLFMGISTFQVAKSFVFQNYLQINAAVLIRLVFIGIMMSITYYLISTGIKIFDFAIALRKKQKDSKSQDHLYPHPQGQLEQDEENQEELNKKLKIS